MTFRPDFGKFVQKGFSDSMLAVLMRRAYDIAGILRVKVSVNDKQLPIRGFEQYVRMYVGEG